MDLGLHRYLFRTNNKELYDSIMFMMKHNRVIIFDPTPFEKTLGFTKDNEANLNYCKIIKVDKRLMIRGDIPKDVKFSLNLVDYIKFNLLFNKRMNEVLFKKMDEKEKEKQESLQSVINVIKDTTKEDKEGALSKI